MEHIEVELKILGRLRADSFEQGLKMMLPSIICAAGNLPAHVTVEVISLARSAREIVSQVYVSVYMIASRPCITARSRSGIPKSGVRTSIRKTPVSCLRERAVLN